MLPMIITVILILNLYYFSIFNYSNFRLDRKRLPSHKPEEAEEGQGPSFGEIGRMGRAVHKA